MILRNSYDSREARIHESVYENKMLIISVDWSEESCHFSCQAVSIREMLDDGPERSPESALSLAMAYCHENHDGADYLEVVTDQASARLRVGQLDEVSNKEFAFEMWSVLADLIGAYSHLLPERVPYFT